MPGGRDTYILVSLEEFIRLTNKAKDTVEKSSKSMERHTKSTENTFLSLSGTLKTVIDRFRLMALIGMGTLAMLFMNTPIMQAGFAKLKASLTELFITLQDNVNPEFDKFANIIHDINDYLEEHDTIRKLVTTLVELGVVMAIITVFIMPFYMLARVVMAMPMLFWALTGVFFKLGGAFRFVYGFLSIVLTDLIEFGRFLFTPFGIAIGIAIALIIGAFRNWKEVLEDVKRVIKGFLEVASGIGLMLEGLFTLDWDTFKEGFKSFFVGIYDIVKGVLDILADAIEGFLMTIDDFTSMFGINLRLGERFESLTGKYLGTTITPSGRVIKSLSVDDAIITPSGTVIRTHPDDYIIATRTPGAPGGGAPTNITISFEGAKIYLSDGLDIDDFTDNLAMQINDKIRRVR